MNREKHLFKIITLFNQLTLEQQESFCKYCELMYDIQDLPLEQQQEIIDNIQDEDILEIIKIRKSLTS